MSFAHSKIYGSWSKGPVLALAAMVGVLGAAGSAEARRTATADRHHHQGETQRETIDQRIASLHSALKITPDQETLWAEVAQTMRFNDTKMRELVASTETERQTAGGRTALEELKTYEQFNRAHLDGLKELLTSFETLYTAMPDSQKLVADRAFERFGRAGLRPSA
jgi:hypothetical protein